MLNLIIGLHNSTWTIYACASEWIELVVLDSNI